MPYLFLLSHLWLRRSSALLGATPVFVDSDPNTWNISVSDLERAIEEVKKEGKLNLKAVIAVDIFGNPADYDEITAVAHKNGMKVLSDAAQSYGSVYKGKRAGFNCRYDINFFLPDQTFGLLWRRRCCFC